MFVVTTVHDTVRIPPQHLALPTRQALEMEIDARYPNRVLLDVGLVVGRWPGPLVSPTDPDTVTGAAANAASTALEVQHGGGACLAGDGGAHCACRFRLLVFRPFAGQVCRGRVARQTPQGLHVSLGFFDAVFVPAYWMLNPSRFEAETRTWVWTPRFDDDDEDSRGGVVVDDDEDRVKRRKLSDGVADGAPAALTDAGIDAAQAPPPARYEVETGAEIRFRVKEVRYTRVTHTAKGLQATTTAAGAARERSTSIGQPEEANGGCGDRPVHRAPAMEVIASICEDGLGLTSWWTADAGGLDEGEEIVPT